MTMSKGQAAEQRRLIHQMCSTMLNMSTCIIHQIKRTLLIGVYDWVPPCVCCAWKHFCLKTIKWRLYCHVTAQRSSLLRWMASKNERNVTDWLLLARVNLICEAMISPAFHVLCKIYYVHGTFNFTEQFRRDFCASAAKFPTFCHFYPLLLLATFSTINEC